MMSLRLAVRNLLRNRWRTGLAAGGIAVATAILIWNIGMFDGFFQLMIRGSTDVEIGHVQVQDRDYIDQPATFDYFDWDDEVKEAIEETPRVEAATPRVRLFGLVGHEERSHVAAIYGVDPDTEPSVTVMADGIERGRWLDAEMPPEPPAEVVVGAGMGRTLGVDVGDELVVIAEGADGSMGDGLLEVVGILETGNSQIDRRAAVIHLDEAQFIAATDGGVHEVVAATDNPIDAPHIASAMQARLDAADYDELRARSWQQVEPGLYELLAYGDTANRFMLGIIFIVVALGVLNALRMSARERHREFGGMMAVGMSRKRLFAMIVAEGAILGFVGAVVGGIVGTAVTWYHSVRGLDFGLFVEGDATYMGISFTEVIYFVLSWEAVLTPLIGLIAVTVVCAVWPAIASIRLNPRDAITGRV